MFIVYVGFTAVVLIQASNITIVSFKGSTGTLPCRIASNNYPRWEDQNGIAYNYQDKPAFNHVQLPFEKFSRLEWASNKRDLTIKNVTLQDSGIYHCVVNSTMYFTELEVIGLYAYIQNCFNSHYIFILSCN